MFPESTTPADPSPWPPRHPVDLKAFVQALSPDRAIGSPTPAAYRRTAILVESASPRPIKTAPLVPLGFLDGIQRRAIAGRIEHRDLTIAYVSAGTVHDTTLLNVQERLAVLCSVEDERRVRSALPDVPVVAFPEILPWGVASATEDWIDGTRRHLEALALDRAPQAEGRFVVVDGSLRADCHRADAVSIVKDALRTEWLPDTSLLPAAGGWRSPALRLPASRADERARLTCFVRLRDADGCHPWGFSLIRVESFEDAGIEVLEAAAALAVAQRQPLGCGDPRAEIHLAGMRRTEEVLRARAPFALDVLP